MKFPLYKPSDFTAFQRRLTLCGTLRLETALRVATGREDGMSATDIAVFKDQLRRPFIPGSSLKGALRAHIERIVRSSSPGEACDPLDERGRCLNNDEMDGLRSKYKNGQAGLAEEVLSHTCRVCRLFGSPWLASKVMVRDLTLVQPEMWAERRYEVRTNVAIDRDSETAKDGALYDSQVVPPGVAFQWQIMVENADPQYEEPLLYLGMREMMGGHLPLGGGKSRGLGNVRLFVDEAKSEIVDGQALSEYLVTGKGSPVVWAELEKRIGKCIQSLGQQE